LDAFLEIVLGIGSVISTINEISEVKDADEDADSEDSDFEDGENYIGETELQNLDELLESMPSPDPEAAPESEPEYELDQNFPAEPPAPEKTGEQEVESVWIRQDANALPDIHSSNESVSAEDYDETQPREMEKADLPQEESIASETEPAEEPLEPTVPGQPVIESIVEISSASAPGTSPLGVKSVRFEYFCVLIPDNPNQYLARDLSDRLGFILPQIHISKGWRVTSLAVRPLFLMWQISLPADTCPADAVDEIRRRTTSHFFTNFPHLLTGNTGNDFWAPGYLILSGAQAPSNSLISEFIQRTRLAQQKTNG
jgi:REP element-mobilizing transposase RayT